MRRKLIIGGGKTAVKALSVLCLIYNMLGMLDTHAHGKGLLLHEYPAGS